ncbi:MAG: hypothetical protein IIC86_08860 [Chloroflexi bacterium]|nr:hypothetical protein [Chloroflexota bacterium]
MTTLVSPEQFVKVFREVAGREESDLYKLWWSSNKKYTDKFLAPHAGVMAEVAGLLDLEYRREKVRMDAMLYKPVNGVRAVLVAVEHENAAETAKDEAWRLSLLNVPLKVLFTYPEHGEEALLLGEYARVLSDANVFGQFDGLRRQLVIFGFADESDRTIDWRSYLHSDKGFVSLEATP